MLIENKPWLFGQRPSVLIKVLTFMIILKLKRDEKGRPARFKALFVALGNLLDDMGLLF